MALRHKRVGVGGTNLTSRQAARLLGVSEASIKRWADSGLLPMEKTAGGHRRFRPEDISVMRRDRLQASSTEQARSKAARAGVVNVAPRTEAGARLTSEQKAALAKEAFQILVDGRTEEMGSLLINLHLNGLSVASIADRVICPAMRRVGDLWYRGELSIATEHVATRSAMEAVNALRSAIRPEADPNLVALCCSTEEDFHEFPVVAAAAVLEEKGFDVVNLGPSMPFFALSDAVQKFQPRLVCVAATTHLISLERTVRDYGEFSKQAGRAGSAIVLGGVGFEGREIRERLPADLHADSFEQLEKLVGPMIKKVASEKN